MSAPFSQDSMAHLRAILRKWKTTAGGSLAATVPGISGLPPAKPTGVLSTRGNPSKPPLGPEASHGTSSQAPSANRSGSPHRGTEEHLRDLTYGLDLLAEAVEKLEARWIERLGQLEGRLARLEQEPAPVPLQGEKALRKAIQQVYAETIPVIGGHTERLAAIEYAQRQPRDDQPPTWVWRLGLAAVGASGLCTALSLVLVFSVWWRS